MSSVLDSLLGGGGASAGGGMPASIPDPEPHLAPADSPDSAPDSSTVGHPSEVDSLKTMLGMGKDYLDIPTVDEGEKLKMHKALSILQGLLADNQKMADGLTGADPAIRKALG